MKITADFIKITGKIKPMHGVGQPPFCGVNDQFMHYLGDAGIPYSRLHDVGGMFGGGLFVDIPNIFRDFDADETKPESYDFTFTDWLLSELKKQNCEPFYRLGVTIEGYQRMKAYRIFPPKDYEKWAGICEHIVAHYNEGWADGFHMGITYWEIWNEPDNHIPGVDNAMWTGTAQDYFRLYDVASKRLKARFGDAIKVGGYASCGFYGMAGDPKLEGLEKKIETRDDYYIYFIHEFFRFIKENRSPLDFFSWHTYADVHTALEFEDYCQSILHKYGFEDVEDILNEWNTAVGPEIRSTPLAAARALAMMLGMQKKKVGILAYYDAGIGINQYGGMFNPDTWKPYLTYYAFMSFNEAYKLRNEILTMSDNENVFVCGATNEDKSVLLISNINANEVCAELDVKGADLGKAEILMIDSIHNYTPTGIRILDERLSIPANSCVEIRL